MHVVAVLAVSSSLALAEQTQIERMVADGDEEEEVVLTSSMISDVSLVYIFFALLSLIYSMHFSL